jgi:hypothetical protein
MSLDVLRDPGVNVIKTIFAKNLAILNIFAKNLVIFKHFCQKFGDF